MAKLTDKQLTLAIDILKTGKALLSKESETDYVIAASFIFDNGFMFFPGVALEGLQAERAGRTALASEGGGR